MIAAEQFPSNVYPWMKICEEYNCSLKTVHPPSDMKNRGKEWNNHILEAIDKNTILVAIANVHWTDGTRFDVKQIGKAARDVDAWFVIDGTQSVGALPFDVREVQPDALICAGYKWLLGPYGTTIGYFGPKLANAKPLEEGWIARKNSRDFRKLVDYETEYEPGSIRFDVGERSNFLNTPMMLKALQMVNKWTPNTIQTYCKNLCASLIDELRENGFSIEDENWRGNHLFGVRLPAHSNLDAVQDKLTSHNVHVSARGSSIRVSPHLYNNRNDLVAFRNALLEA